MSERMINSHQTETPGAKNNADLTTGNNANGITATAMHNASSSSYSNTSNIKQITEASISTTTESKPISHQQISNGVARTPKGKDISNYVNAPSSITATAAIAKRTSLPKEANFSALDSMKLSSGGTDTVTTAVAFDSTTMDGKESTPNQKTQAKSKILKSPTNIMLKEDEKMRKFLMLLSMRQKPSNNTHIHQSKASDATATSIIGPTVPHSLSKRILNRQGVNYMDESITAIMSGAADRFLATILQQSMICHHLRLQGEEREKKEKRAIHKLKKRRREERKQKHDKRLKLEQELEKVIPHVNAMGKKSLTKKGISSVSSKLIQDAEKFINDDEGIDTLDEEMDYYDKQTRNENDNDVGDDHDIEEEISDEDEDDEDDSKLTLQLCDIVRPLDAWDISLTGKIGLSVSMMKQDDDEIENEALDDDDDSNSEADGDFDVDGDDEDDDISMATSKTGGKKMGKRTPTPKLSKSSPSKAKPTKKDTTPKND